MCGIFAWSGENVKHFNKAKFDILGIFNDSRGGDSCGVSTDGEIYYGVLTGMKKYSQFIVEKDYLSPKRIPVVIGHTRKSSVGIVNENNAHPFGFGVNEKHDSFEFVGAHNGTLYNQEELAKEHGVEMSVMKENEFNVKVFDRRKIDSEVLLEIIYKTQNFKVLSDYNGGAAILFTNTLEPNVIYAFHGASSETKNGTPIEERPLFYYQETKNSLYISSMAESLIAIGGTLYKNVDEFECNKVYKITNGNFASAEIFDISRIQAFQKRETVTYGKHHNARHDYGYGYENYDDYGNVNTGNRWSDDYRETQKNHHGGKGKKEREVLKDIENIYKEEVLHTHVNKTFTFNQFRFRRNGHLVTGIFTYFKEYGLVPLNIEPHQVPVTISSIIGKIFSFNSGTFIDHISESMVNDIHYTIPFKVSEGKTPPIMYIYEGVMMQTELDYIHVKSLGLTNYCDLSFCSTHPVIDVKVDSKSNNSQGILKDGVPYDGKVSPFYSNKIYNISHGNLKSIHIVSDIVEDNIKKETPVIILPHVMSQCKLPLNIDCIKDSKVSYDKEIVNFMDNVEEDDDTIDSKELKEIDELLTEHYKSTLILNDDLIKFENNAFAEKAIEMNNEYLECIEELSTEITK